MVTWMVFWLKMKRCGIGVLLGSALKPTTHPGCGVCLVVTSSMTYPSIKDSALRLMVMAWSSETHPMMKKQHSYLKTKRWLLLSLNRALGLQLKRTLCQRSGTVMLLMRTSMKRCSTSVFLQQSWIGNFKSMRTISSFESKDSSVSRFTSVRFRMNNNPLLKSKLVNGRWIRQKNLRYVPA